MFIALKLRRRGVQPTATQVPPWPRASWIETERACVTTAMAATVSQSGLAVVLSASMMFSGLHRAPEFVSGSSAGLSWRRNRASRATGGGQPRQAEGSATFLPDPADSHQQPAQPTARNRGPGCRNSTNTRRTRPQFRRRTSRHTGLDGHPRNARPRDPGADGLDLRERARRRAAHPSRVILHPLRDCGRIVADASPKAVWGQLRGHRAGGIDSQLCTGGRRPARRTSKHCAVDSYCCNTQWARIATVRCPGLLGPPPSQIPQPARREDHGEAP
jgi:hypothetical protein